MSKNRAEDDNILGDACEYLMLHFATESSKSKGQFLRPMTVIALAKEVLAQYTLKPLTLANTSPPG